MILYELTRAIGSFLDLLECRFVQAHYAPHVLLDLLFHFIFPVVSLSPPAPVKVRLDRGQIRNADYLEPSLQFCEKSQLKANIVIRSHHQPFAAWSACARFPAKA